MRLTLLHRFATLLLVTYLFLSCKKELSCEGCTNGNEPPVSNAGKDQVLTLPADSVFLDGSISSDADGKINGWQWTKISGPVSFQIVSDRAVKTIIKNLTAGVYQFELKVTDDKGASATDTVMITLEATPTTNQPPIANAGIDTTIISPGNTVNLNGSLSSAPNNNITSYLWTKISGPSVFNIVNASVAQTQAINLVQGVYLFELKVTDAGAMSDRDTVQVTVMDQVSTCTNCKIVFVSDRDGNPEIYSCKMDGTNITRLTDDKGTDDQPAWSPDRSQIAFVSDRSGSPEIYIMNADGSNVIRRTFSGHSQNPTWLPDGKKIGYSSLSNGSANIWIVGALSGSPSLLLEQAGFEGAPSWSPDGTRVVLFSDWNAYDLIHDIYTINSDGTNLTELTTGDVFDGVDYLYPRWSPDGTKIALAVSRRIGIDQYDTKVGVINPNGVSITILTSGAAYWTRTSWSADGTKVLYTSLTGTRTDVSWVSVDGSSWGTIVTNGWNAD